MEGVMGMDLEPHHGGNRLHYNLAGWGAIRKLAWLKCKVTLPCLNEGEEIPADICWCIGNGIEEHAEWYNNQFGGGGYGEAPAAEHAWFWKNSTGVSVW